MEIRELADRDHEVLGAEYCSGYTDIFGKWNTGFYCPNLGNGETVYCCGTLSYKYCCTRRDQQTSGGFSQAVIFGSAIGALLVLALLTLVSCLVCRKCPPYRRAHHSLSGGPLYSMHCSSTASGMANMYSGQNTAVTTPLDPSSDPHNVLLDLDSSREVSTPHRPFVLHRAFGHLPSEPPPPYNDTGGCDQNVSSVRESSTTSFTSHIPNGQHLAQGRTSSSVTHHQPMRNIINDTENLYWSTKF